MHSILHCTYCISNDTAIHLFTLVNTPCIPYIPDDDVPTSGNGAGMDASNEQASEYTVIRIRSCNLSQLQNWMEFGVLRHIYVENVE